MTTAPAAPAAPAAAGGPATALPGYSSCTIAQGMADTMADAVGRLLSEELGIRMGVPTPLVDPETGAPVGMDVTVRTWGETRTVPSTDGGDAYASDVVVSVDRDGRWASVLTRCEYASDVDAFLAAVLSEVRSALDGE